MEDTVRPETRQRARSRQREEDPKLLEAPEEEELKGTVGLEDVAPREETLEGVVRLGELAALEIVEEDEPEAAACGLENTCFVGVAEELGPIEEE